MSQTPVSPALNRHPIYIVLAALACTSCTQVASTHESVADAAEPQTQVTEKETLKSLWTRKKGVDWPGFLGPNHDSKSPETGLISPWPKGGLKIVWQRKLGTGYGMGSVAGGRFYQFDRFKKLARLYCMNAETGEVLWKFEYSTDYTDMLGYNNGPRCSPVVDGNRVYIYGVEGMLHCLDATDGDVLWKVDTVAEYGVVKNFFGVGSTPIVEGDLLICMVGGSPAGSPGLYESGGRVDGNGSGIVAFDKVTGKEKYKITDELASYASLQVATIDKRRWCFAFCRGGLVGFEPQTGKVDFEYPWRSPKLESVNAAAPVVMNNEVFISETYDIGSSLLKVKPGSYDVVWKDDERSRKKSMMTHWNTGIHVDGYLYACSGRNEPDADLRCIEWKTGKVQWIKEWDAEVRERSSLLYVDGHFIYLGEFGTLKLLKVNPKKYEVVSELVPTVKDLKIEDDADSNDSPTRRLFTTPAWAAPILSHGLLYVRGNDRLVCYEAIEE